MKRRNFLLLRRERMSRVAELSCERLFMHYQQLGTTMGATLQGPAPDVWELSEEEPPGLLMERTTQELFAGVDRELREADVLRVVDTEWLGVDVFRQDVDALLEAFRRRGGRVEYRQDC